jgi:hypothetical protein
MCCLVLGFCAGTLSGSCLDCPAHSTNQGDSSTCTACDAGYERPFKSISSQCAPCGGNEVSVSGAACTRCFSGEVANGQHTECVQCPAVCGDMYYHCVLVCMCVFATRSLFVGRITTPCSSFVLGFPLLSSAIVLGSALEIEPLKFHD